MIGTYAKRLRAPDYPVGADARRSATRFFEEIVDNWGGPVGIETRAPSIAPIPAFRDWWSNYPAHGREPGAPRSR